MIVPKLSELPLPAFDQTGWPWSMSDVQKAVSLSKDTPWPRISIVTPSYNQGHFLEETIRSVLLQGYPNLEYIIIDGGSTDYSVEIIKKYEPWLTYWVSELDRGQSHAINKGAALTTGMILGYLNSDDLLLPHALEAVGRFVANHLNERLLILGNCDMGYSIDHLIDTWCSEVTENYVMALGKDSLFPQPSTFWTREISNLAPHFDERLNFIMDIDYWCQLLKAGYKTVHLNQTLAFYRYHANTKSRRLGLSMWSELAGLALLKVEELDSVAEKIVLVGASRRRTRHYLRLLIEKAISTSGRAVALKSLIDASASDWGFLLERPTLGLARRLLFGRTNNAGVSLHSGSSTRKIGHN